MYNLYDIITCIILLHPCLCHNKFRILLCIWPIKQILILILISSLRLPPTDGHISWIYSVCFRSVASRHSYYFVAKTCGILSHAFFYNTISYNSCRFKKKHSRLQDDICVFKKLILLPGGNHFVLVLSSCLGSWQVNSWRHSNI